MAYALPSLAPWKDCELVVMGSHMRSRAFQLALYASLRTLVGELGVQAFNAAITFDPVAVGSSSSSICSWGPGGGAGGAGGAAGSSAPAGAADGPCTARVVSRGRLASGASDFGGLEVFGGASIAHTDPFAVGAALDRVLAGLGAQQAQRD